MHTKTHQLAIIHRGVRKAGPAELLEADDDQVRLVVTMEGLRLEPEATDYFEALQKIRTELEKDGVELYCYSNCAIGYASDRIHPRNGNFSHGFHG